MKLLLVTFICLLVTQIFCKNADTIEYYKKLIANANKTFYTYKLPHDASEYAPADDQTPKGNIIQISLNGIFHFSQFTVSRFWII